MLGAYARDHRHRRRCDALVEAMRESIPPYRTQHIEANERALRAGWDLLPAERVSRPGRSAACLSHDQDDQEPRHRHDRRRALQGLRALHPRVPAGVLTMSTAVNHMGYRYPELHPGCTGCAACLLRVPRLRVRGVPLRARRIDDGGRRHDRDRDRAARVLMEGSRGAGARRDRRRLPVLRRLPDDAVHRGARALRHACSPTPAACASTPSRELEAVGMAWGALADRRARRDRLDRPGPLADAGVVLGDHARRAAARRSSTWRAASRTTTRRRGAAGTATTATSCSRRRTSREGVELVQLAFHLADKWRNPVLVYGDYLLAHTQEAVDDRADRVPRRCRAKDWAVDGSRVGQRRRRSRSRRSASPSTASAASARKARRSTSPRRCRSWSARCASRPATSTTPRPWSSRSARPAKFVKYAIAAAARRGRQDRLRAADHAVAVPVRRRSRAAADGRAARRRRSSSAPAR